MIETSFLYHSFGVRDIFSARCEYKGNKTIIHVRFVVTPIATPTPCAYLKKAYRIIWLFKILFVISRITKKKGEIGMKEKRYTTDQEQIARFAKAMGHPTRMAILTFLAKQDSCFFGDIHEELPIAKATVSQHLKELKEAGLIQGEIETPKVRYCINRENWELARKLFAAFLGDCKCKDTSCCE